MPRESLPLPGVHESECVDGEIAFRQHRDHGDAKNSALYALIHPLD